MDLFGNYNLNPQSNYTPIQNRDILGLQKILAEQVLRAKEQYGRAQSDEARQQQANMANFVRSLMENSQGYGAENPLWQSKAIYDQQIARPKSDERWIPYQRPLTYEEANFGEHPSQHIEPLNQQDMRYAKQILELKNQYGQAQEIANQAAVILQSSTATQSEKSLAEKQYLQAQRMMQMSNARAEQLRKAAGQSGIRTEGYGAENTLSDAQTQYETEMNNIINRAFNPNGDMYQTSGEYYQDRYNYYREQGRSRRKSEELAMADARRYGIERSRQLQDILQLAGLDENGAINQGYGQSAMRELIGENPQLAQYLANTNALPKNVFEQEQNRLNTELQHAYDIDKANNAAANAMQLAMYQGDLQKAIQELAGNQKMTQLQFAAEANLNLERYKALNRLTELGRKHELAIDTAKYQKILQDEKTDFLANALVKSGKCKSYEEAIVWIYQLHDPTLLQRTTSARKPSKEGEEKLTKEENILSNYVKIVEGEIRTHLNNDDKESAIATIDIALEWIADNSDKGYDGDLINAFRSDLYKYRKRLEEGKPIEESNPPAKNPPKENPPQNPNKTWTPTNQTKYDFSNWTRWNPYGQGYTPFGNR